MGDAGMPGSPDRCLLSDCGDGDDRGSRGMLRALTNCDGLLLRDIVNLGTCSIGRRGTSGAGAGAASKPPSTGLEIVFIEGLQVLVAVETRLAEDAHDLG